MEGEKKTSIAHKDCRFTIDVRQCRQRTKMFTGNFLNLFLSQNDIRVDALSWTRPRLSPNTISKR